MPLHARIYLLLIEPFTGGGIAGLTVAYGDFTNIVYLAEKDDKVANVWQSILSKSSNTKLIKLISQFKITYRNIDQQIRYKGNKKHKTAFITILKNRTNFGGNIHKAGRSKKIKNFRFNPVSLCGRLSAIQTIQGKIKFCGKDAFRLIEKYSRRKDVFFFIDPPYFHKGTQLYKHGTINHERLFKIISKIKGQYILTYDDCREIKLLVRKYGMKYKKVKMTTNRHKKKFELLIEKAS